MGRQDRVVCMDPQGGGITPSIIWRLLGLLIPGGHMLCALHTKAENIGSIALTLPI